MPWTKPTQEAINAALAAGVGRRNPVEAAASTAGNNLRLWPDSRPLALWLADAVLARRLLLRRDEDGFYYFVDRNKDAIRRRGENVSSFEVEAEILAHPDILEAAAVGVSSEFGEVEILAVVVLKPGRSASNETLLEFLAKRLPYFMVPRYIRRIDSLPKTQTDKVEKHRLRSDGMTEDTWDREKFGFRIARPKL
ncbi:AMP-binding enzyme [Mesorhizobium sp. A556]